MSVEQLERSRMQRLRDSVRANASDARNYVNRFFGAKVCGKCDGCSGGNCDSCKGKPAVSLWDAASSMPAVEDRTAQSSLGATSKENRPAPTTDQTQVSRPTVASLPAAESPGPEIRAAQDDNSRLVHLRQSASDELPLLRLSGNRLIQSGLNIVAPEPERPPAELSQPAVHETPAIALPPPSRIEVRSGLQIQSLDIRPAHEPVSRAKQLRAPVSEERIAAPVQDALSFPPHPEAFAGKQDSGPGAAIESRPAEAKSPPHHPARLRHPHTVLENPCAQAIIKMKYSRTLREPKEASARFPAGKAAKRESCGIPPEAYRAEAGKKAARPAEFRNLRREKPLPVIAGPKPALPEAHLKATKKLPKTAARDAQEKIPAHRLQKDKHRITAPLVPALARKMEKPSSHAISRRKKSRQAAHKLILLMDLLSRGRKRKASRKTALSH
ncbi:MAG TPA: hypothetical protein VLD37_04580 [Candidatus Bilamarchaeum sp.]|nr:hypothetical protein [Candidatus Bilamarchaeum sp.]